MINRRYINLALIPAFFAIILSLFSCTKGEITLEPFIDFSTSEQDLQAITETNEKTAKVKDKKSAELNFVRRYHIGYLAFDVADIYFEATPVSASENYVKYRSRVYSRTNGTVDYFMGWMSHTVGYARIYDDKIVPESFRTKVKHKNKIKEIELAYDSSGKNFVTDNVIPPDNRAKRPAVTAEEKRGAFDPLSAFFEARRNVSDAVEKSLFNNKGVYNFTVPVYDGRRRTDVLFTLQNNKNEDGLLNLSFSLKPVAGYTNNELDKDEGSSKTSLTVLLEQKTYLPVKVIGTHPLGTASADYISDCTSTFDECIKN